MSVTELRPASAPRAEAALPSASLLDSVGVVVTGLLPALARGLFSPRRGAMKLLTAVDADRRTVDFMTGLRRRLGGEGARLLGGRMVVVWGERALREVLDQSADLYASDAGAKAKGMSHFQPYALTLSRGEDWRDRREFTETVLASREQAHPLAERFLAVVEDEVARMRLGDELRWADWEKLFDHITLRVIFGDGARSDQELTALLEKLMGQANRIAGLKRGDDYHELYGRLERYLADPAPGSLVSLFADAPQSDRTRPVHQLPHWMFAMRDTLGANAYRALALTDLPPDEALEQAMRRWPTTPLLAREVTKPTTLAGVRVEEGTQVFILNVFNHRALGNYNHLSSGAQSCPGAGLVRLLGEAVLERVRSEWVVRPLGKPDDFYALRFAVEPR